MIRSRNIHAAQHPDDAVRLDVKPEQTTSRDASPSKKQQQKVFSSSHPDSSLYHAGSITKEANLFVKSLANMFKGPPGSYMSFLFIPAMISFLWVLVCIFTTRTGSISLEQRLTQSSYKEYFQNKAKVADPEDHDLVEKIHLPTDVRVHVAIAMAYLDVNPLVSAQYLINLQRILMYSSVPVSFHILTNVESTPYVNQIMEKLNGTAEQYDFDVNIVTLTQLFHVTRTDICPSLRIKEDFCDIIVGNIAPALFPFLFPTLDHIIFINSNIFFQDNIALLYSILAKMKRSTEGIAMAPEQTKKYMGAFSAWQSLNPSTRLGRPPPEGKPGFNTDLILMDLEKLRASAKYKIYLDERRLKNLFKNYMYQGVDSVPNIDDFYNILAADYESFVWNLGCEWNRWGRPTNDSIEKKFHACKGKHRIHVWNGHEAMVHEKDLPESRHIVPISHSAEELR